MCSCIWELPNTYVWLGVGVHQQVQYSACKSTFRLMVLAECTSSCVVCDLQVQQQAEYRSRCRPGGGGRKEG